MTKSYTKKVAVNYADQASQPIRYGKKSSSELCQARQAAMTKSYTKKVAVNSANQDGGP